MPKANKHISHSSTDRLLCSPIIVQLGLAGIGQRQIRSIVGGNMKEINSVVKSLRVKRSTPHGKEE